MAISKAICKNTIVIFTGLIGTMDIKAALLQEHSKTQAQRIAAYIGSDPERFNELMDLFLKGEYRVTQRAAWVLFFCTANYPELTQPYLSPLVSNLEQHVPDAVKRNTLRHLQHISIPANLQGQLATVCFNILTGSEPVAIKVFAMTVLANLAQSEPDLGQELKIIIQDQLPHASAAFKARSRIILQQLTPKHSLK